MMLCEISDRMTIDFNWYNIVNAKTWKTLN